MRSGLAWLWTLTILIGCSQSGPTNQSVSRPPTGGQPTNPAAGKKFRLAVIPKGTTHEFWKSVHAGAEKAAKELGDVEILWKGPALEADRAGQIQVVQDFIVQKVDGIILAPLDSQALVEYVEEAAE